MRKITIVSTDGDAVSPQSLIDYADDHNIEVVSTDEHKLLLDISRNGDFAVDSDGMRSKLYIPEVMSKSQVNEYNNNYDLNGSNIVAYYNWTDSKSEFNGYSIREANDYDRDNKLATEVRDIMMRKVKGRKK